MPRGERFVALEFVICPPMIVRFLVAQVHRLCLAATGQRNANRRLPIILTERTVLLGQFGLRQTIEDSAGVHVSRLPYVEGREALVDFEVQSYCQGVLHRSGSQVGEITEESRDVHRLMHETRIVRDIAESGKPRIRFG